MIVASSRRLRTLSLALGLCLLLSATWSVVRNHALAGSAWAALRNPDPASATLLPLAVIATIALTSLSLRILTARAAPFTAPAFTEMTALTLASSLGNMVPVQAGLAGRLAYQQRVHGIPIAIGVLIAVQSTLLTLVAGAWLGAALLVVRAAGLSWIAAPASIALIACGLADPRWRCSVLLHALLMRCIEVLLSALRVHACFTLIGNPIEPPACLALGIAGNLSNAIPMLGGALGVREWIVGLLAPVIGGVATTEALAAELLNRVLESLVIVVGGLLSTPMLARKLDEALRIRVIDPPTRSAHPTETVDVEATPIAQRESDASPPKMLPPPAS